MAMDTTSIPAALTPLAFTALVVMQVMQLIGNHLKARADTAARNDGSMATILQKVLDQHAAAAERQAVASATQAQAMERVATSMAEIQAHMHGTNAALTSLATRIELVEARMAASTAKAQQGG